MKLPFMSLFQSKAPKDYFLALLFRDEKIHAVVFEQINGRIQVIGEGKATLVASIERTSDETLLEAADRAISVAEGNLPNGITTHKTVFGVKETWVEDTHITKDYLSRLKTMSDQLDLKPIGFLVFSEAIAHLLQKEEGAPVSAILVEVGRKQATITLIRAGRIVGTKEIAVQESLTDTVESALKQFDNVEIFPSRIILFDQGDETLEKKFLSHKWSKTLPFLHVPQITTLPQDFDTRAILFGTATQMGLDAIDLVKQPIKKSFASEVSQAEVAPESNLPDEEVMETTRERVEPEEEIVPEEKGIKEKQPYEEMEEVSGNDTSEYFGFVKDSDIASAEGHPHPTNLPSDAIDSVTEEIPEEEKEEELAGSAPGFGKSGALFIEGAKKVFAQMKRFVPGKTSLAGTSSLLSNLPGNGNKLLLIIPAVIILLLIFFLWYLFGLHAKVTLFLTPKTISQDVPVTFTTSGASDVSKSLIAANVVSVSEQGKVSGDTTGTKDIGNKAKGTVTIFNSDNASHTLTANTTIISSNGLKFTLDKDVTVASGSSDPTNLSAGTADVTVTASDIGTDYNLPSNTKFSISSTSVLAAKNANAFSGGTKTSITVVAQKDMDSLVSQLVENLKDKAKSDLQGKVSGDEVILPDFTKAAAGITNFDKKVGDESKSLNLDGSVTYETISYKKSDIEKYTKNALSGQLPSNLALSQDGITYSVKDITTKDGITKVTLTAKASLVPSLDTKALSGQISGKSFADARDILSGIPQFSDATFTLSPNLFFFPKSLPRFSGNITITVVTHE